MKKREVYRFWKYPCEKLRFIEERPIKGLLEGLYKTRRDLLWDSEFCPCGKGCKPIKCRVIVENEVGGVGRELDGDRVWEEDYNVKKEEYEELLELVEDFVYQDCYVDKEGGIFDSMALSTYAYALRLLARLGRVEIIKECGDRIIAKKIYEGKT